MESKVFKVNTLGVFSIEYDGIYIDETINRTQRVWLLIKYLVLNNHRQIHSDELYKLLWNDEVDDDKAANALKNLVYRARKTLEEFSQRFGQDLILFATGCYRWNSNSVVKIDTDELVQDIEYYANRTRNKQEKTKLIQNVIELYKGEYLPNTLGGDWVGSQRIKFSSIYHRSVLRLCYLYEENKDYLQIIEVIKKALVFYEFDEAFHRVIILTYIKLGQTRKALNHYTAINEKLYEQLGVVPSSTLRSVYKTIISSHNDIDIDGSVVLSDLQDVYDVSSAYYCEYEVFKNIYKIQARSIERTGQVIHLILLTASSQTEDFGTLKNRVKIISNLKNSILTNLRKGDVVSSYSSLQFAVLVPLTSYENCMEISKRINKQFEKLNKSDDIMLTSIVRCIQTLDYNSEEDYVDELH